MRLILFPHAGGTRTYHDWGAELPEWIDAWVVTLPGRGARTRENQFSHMAELTDAVVTSLHDHGLLSTPLAFFGHSFGALAAFETAHVLRERGLSTPVQLRHCCSSFC